jgi:hypothetical protein
MLWPVRTKVAISAQPSPSDRSIANPTMKSQRRRRLSRQLVELSTGLSWRIDFIDLELIFALSAR